MKSLLEKIPILKLYKDSRILEFIDAANALLLQVSGSDRDVLLYYSALAYKKLGHSEIAMDHFREVIQNNILDRDYIVSSLINLGMWSFTIQDCDYSDACLHEYQRTNGSSTSIALIWRKSIDAFRKRSVEFSSISKLLLEENSGKDGLEFFCIALNLLDCQDGIRPLIDNNPDRLFGSPIALSTAAICRLQQGDLISAAKYVSQYDKMALSPFMEVKSEFLKLRIELAQESESPAAYNKILAMQNKLRNFPRKLVGGMYEYCSRLLAEKSGFQQILVSRRHGMIGESPGLERVREMIDLYANSDLNVLIRGDSGTGKELVAIALHQSSRRRNQGFVPVNCYHLGTQLAEARLFGHRKGAFTGATQDAPGFVHEAHGGTLFLDEVGELPLEAQANLFRFLDSGQFRRVGSTALEKANVRVIAATNQDLSHDSRFRHELYHRLGTVVIDLPPLAARGNDVLQIARCRVAELNVLNGFNKGLAPEAERKLLAHDWPGNVRELLNVIDRAWHASSQEIAGDVLRFDRGVPLHMVASLGWAPDLQPDVVDLDESVNRYTARLVHEMLERCNRDTAETARRLNISERTVYRWMKRNDQFAGNGKDTDTSGSPRA